MKRVKLVSQVLGDNGEVLEENTVEVNLYETVTTTEIPREVIVNRVRFVTNAILREFEERETSTDIVENTRSAYRKLLWRLQEE